MKKLWDSVKQDLWVVLLDLIAVNASYFFALLVRFYVNFELRPIAIDKYLPSWVSFTPWYTLICLVVFILFRLYGGIWRYAGIHDMNRIMLASAVTSIVHVVGTIMFVQRMPITYYVIGAVFQFIAVSVIRFGYRILLVERKRIDNRLGKRIDAIIVGTGENGRRVVKSLEDTEVYRPVAVVGNGIGTMDGLPIVSIDAIPEAQAIFIADALLSRDERTRIKTMAESAHMEYHEYTGLFSNIGGRLSVTDLLAMVHEPVTLKINGEEHSFPDGEAALQSLTEKYTVTEISGADLKITMHSAKKITAQEALEQAYATVRDEE